MENPLIKELLKTVDEFLQSEKGNLNSAVDLATHFSTENSISPDSLLELCYSCLSNETDLAYIFAKTCAILSTENTKKATVYYYGSAEGHEYPDLYRLSDNYSH
ncbi:MAG: hypothetical protein NHB15_13380 [Methanosarcina barkeri]|nr:hypothetical protein [Methanosarcina sp. ERenArc_MAG2]